uniref:Uncharacterized protein n=1 Tax=Megaselia scalaris TaxID=36166 RepID=T1GIW4_MEGSC
MKGTLTYGIKLILQGSLFEDKLLASGEVYTPTRELEIHIIIRDSRIISSFKLYKFLISKLVFDVLCYVLNRGSKGFSDMVNSMLTSRIVISKIEWTYEFLVWWQALRKKRENCKKVEVVTPKRL